MSALLYAAAVVVLIGTSGCDSYLRDPDGTLDAVRRTETLRIGAVVNPPWLFPESDRLQGPEAELLGEFATHLGVAPEWTMLTASEAVRRLEDGELDVVAGGFTEDDPWKERVGMTRPWAVTADEPAGRHVLLVPKGENALLTELERFAARRKSSEPADGAPAT